MMMTIMRKMTNTTTTAAATIPKKMDWLSPAIVALVPPLDSAANKDRLSAGVTILFCVQHTGLYRSAVVTGSIDSVLSVRRAL